MVAIVSVLFAVTLTIQFPQVQTFVAGKVVKTLSEKLDGEISFEKIHLKPFTTLVLKNAVIVDKTPAVNPYDSLSTPIDTFFTAEYIIATFTLDGLFKQDGIHLRKAFIDNAQMNLVLESKDPSEDGEDKAANLTRIFRLKKADPNKPKNMNEIFHIKKVEIRDMGFMMKNYQINRKEFEHDSGINWNDMDVKNIDITASELMFKEGKMSGVAEKVSFREKSGFRAERISGKAIVGGGKTIVEDLHIGDGYSDVNLSLFMMSYRNSEAFSEFITDVKLDGQIEQSTLDFTTISYFAPTLKGNDLRVSLHGNVSGYVNDFEINNIYASSEEGGFTGTVSGKMTGLPDIESTRLNAEVRKFKLTTEGLGTFVSKWMQEGELDISNFAKGTDFSLDAKVDGLMNDMKIDANISSGIGSMTAAIGLKGIVAEEKPINISGTAQTVDLDLGSIIGTDLIRQTSLRTGIKAQLGKGRVRTYAKIDSVIVSRLHVNGYDYSGIAGAGTVAEEAFNGTIICNDPSLNFMFQGAFALSPKTQNARYDFYAVVGHADLNAMNIDKRGTSQIQCQTMADFTRTKAGDIFGKIDIANVIARNDLGEHNIGNINLTSHSSGNEFRARLSSKFADGVYNGSAAMTQFIKDLQNITTRKEMSALYNDPSYEWSGNNYDVSFKFHNSMNLLDYALPGLYIADSTSFNAKISKDGILDSKLQSSRIAFKEQYLKGLSFILDNSGDNLSGELYCKEMRAASMTLRDNSLQILADDNHLGAGYRFDNQDELVNKGEFIVVGNLSRDISDIVNLGINVLPTSLPKLWAKSKI